MPASPIEAAQQVTIALVDAIGKAGLPVRELARVTGMPRASLNRTLKLERQAEVHEIVAVCRAINVNAADLIFAALKDVV